jgi:hypothetical protein
MIQLTHTSQRCQRPTGAPSTVMEFMERIVSALQRDFSAQCLPPSVTSSGAISAGWLAPGRAARHAALGEGRAENGI